MTINPPVLDDRTFDQLVQEALARVPVHTPEWTNLNESDPGVTVLELFAFLTENLLYRANRIPEANRLKVLSMLGIAVAPASPGTGLIVVSDNKGLLPPLPVPTGTAVKAGQVPFGTGLPLTALPVASAVYYKQPQTTLDAATQARYQLLFQTFANAPTDVLTFYKPVALDPPATGKPAPVVDLADPVHGTIDRSLWIALLAAGKADRDAVRRAVAGQTLSIGVFPDSAATGRVLPPRQAGGASVDPGLVFEIAAPEPDPSGRSALGFGIGPARYTRLPVTYADPVLQQPGIVQVTLPAYEKLLLWAFDPEEEGTGDFPPRLDDATVSARLISWVRVRYQPGSGGVDSTCGCGCGGTGPRPDSPVTAAALSGGGATSSSRISWLGVNATRVVQAVTVTGESVGTGTGTPFQTFTLARTPVLVDGAPTALTVEVRDIDGVWHPWSLIDDIYAAGPDDQVFTLEAGSGTLTFGNGTSGLRPPRGAAIRAGYSSGGGAQGAVPIGAINRATTLPGGYSVSNPLATWGAGDGETAAEGEGAVTRWLHHRDRLVTAEDFRELTLRTPGVDLGRVEVLPLFNPDLPDAPHGTPGLVTLMVVPRSDAQQPNAPRPDQQFLTAVCAWLDPRRLVTTEVAVRGPAYRPIRVSVGIATLPGQVPALVEQAVAAAVQAFLSPLTGGLPPTDPGDPAATTATGTGWPLGTAVRPQDIEAVATRVAGVRFVDSVLIAMTGADGAVVSPVDAVPLSGLELPAATVTVISGAATDPAGLAGGAQSVPATQVPVPVVPDTC